MWKNMLVKLALGMLASLPLERIVAILFSRWLDRVDVSDNEKVQKTLKHVAELLVLLKRILEDKQLSPEEVTELRAFASELYKELLSTWAKGKSGKHIEKTLNDTDFAISAGVEPLLEGMGNETPIPIDGVGTSD